MRRALKAGVSAYVVAGMQPERLAAAAQGRDRALRAGERVARRTAGDAQQLAERKRIERAKGILMKERGLDDDAAYAQLRKLAMDRGLKLVDVADRSIEAHDLLG